MEAKQIISLGAGVQSSTMLLMSLAGELPQAECAVFCDTGFEPQSVYNYLDWLEGVADHQDFRIYRTHLVETKEFIDWNGRFAQRKRNIKVDAVNPRITAKMPFYVKNADGTKGMIQRQCTRDWKVDVFEKFVRRELSNLNYREHAKTIIAEKWLGISTDEATRMKTSNKKAFVNRYPLIEIGFSRQDCIDWLYKNAFPIPPKSACIGCPFHDDVFWADMKQNRPDEWQEAVEFDEEIRRASPTLTQECFLHKTLQPLSKVEFLAVRQSNQFENDCEGVCGV